MTKIWYDTEFIDNGRTIELISIGMVREDGEKLYRVNGDPRILSVAVNHPWLRLHVVPRLPVTVIKAYIDGIYDWKWADHPDIEFVEPRWLIASAVRKFITDVPDPQLRAWYAAYDHVALMQLWGPMISKPEGVPMWTFDLKQWCWLLGDRKLPAQDPATEHHELHNAEYGREIDKILEHRFSEWAR
jgi:hypothetical protein